MYYVYLVGMGSRQSQLRACDNGCLIKGQPCEKRLITKPARSICQCCAEDGIQRVEWRVYIPPCATVSIDDRHESV